MNFKTYQTSEDGTNNFTSYNRGYTDTPDNEYQFSTGSSLYESSKDPLFYEGFDEDDTNWIVEDYRDDDDLDQNELGECDECDGLDEDEEMEDFDDNLRFYEPNPSQYSGCYRTQNAYFNNYYPYIMPILFELEDDEEDFSRDSDSKEVNDILNKIECNNQEIYNLLALYNVPYPVARKAFRKITKLTLTYGK